MFEKLQFDLIASSSMEDMLRVFTAFRIRGRCVIHSPDLGIQPQSTCSTPFAGERNYNQSIRGSCGGKTIIPRKVDALSSLACHAVFRLRRL